MSIRRIVVGTDGSEGSLQALRYAATEARAHGASLEVICAWQPAPVGTLPAYGVASPVEEDLTELQTALEQTLEEEGLGPDSDVETTGRVVQEHAARALVGASEDADLLVTGSRGRGGFTGLLLGSVSQHVASHSHCPVTIVPLPDR